ncbi:sulfhydryl oxidase 1 [Sphaeramia orbicularis]|uniref:Sulfhydryl oxidase n=1 Tax=Sphaeramia orbicularis TaxID=375764 RepID=A0A673B839_9TELE|nr:sulfhydryl oxidase 1 [Sphaeramia orbicularis]
MARRCGRATSLLSGQIHFCSRSATKSAVWMCLCLLFRSAAEAGLYTATDQIISLTPDTVPSVLVNSTAVILVEFYASWCGHCISFSKTYKTLARDIKEWKPAVDLAAMDCAADVNRFTCGMFGIRGYPSIKLFRAYSKPESTGQILRGFPRDLQGLRHLIIDKLEKHEEPWPPACPPLEPASQAEIDSFFETNNVQHLALIFENVNSYVGREVTLDLLQFDNIAVRRVLNTEEGLITKLGVTEFPSCYLYYPGGNYTRLRVNIEARTFYSYALQRLPGVVRSGKPPPVKTELLQNNTEEPWKPFNRSRVYMADLESTLHYSLRSELAAYPSIRGAALNALKKYISVLKKYFPGRPMVMNLLWSADSWLQKQTGDAVSYEAFREILDNSEQLPDTALPEGLTWVGCQGSQPHFRRYPCGVWTLFHVLTVQAMNSSDPQEVLSAMRDYIGIFFGCRPCAEHFKTMAEESMAEVITTKMAVLWLWTIHNRVNNRLAGALSEDPNFPKIEWPSPELCSACHTVKENGDHKWNQEEVLPFFVSYYSKNTILTDYLEDESLILEKQREKHASEARKRVGRQAGEATGSMTNPLSTQPTAQEHEEEEDNEEEEEGPQDEAVVDEEARYVDGAEEMVSKTSESPWSKSDLGSRRQVHRKLSIVGIRMREQQEDIVDLDSFVNRHYKAKALRLAASSRVKQRTLQRKEEQEPAPVFGLGMELDGGLGMVGLQPLETHFNIDVGQPGKRLQKRELTGEYFGAEVEMSHRRRWMTALSIGFSKVDISLCVILYFLSFMCLLAMYLFFKNRLRLRRAKTALP